MLFFIAGVLSPNRIANNKKHDNTVVFHWFSHSCKKCTTYISALQLAEVKFKATPTMAVLSSTNFKTPSANMWILELDSKCPFDTKCPLN